MIPSMELDLLHPLKRLRIRLSEREGDTWAMRGDSYYWRAFDRCRK